MVIWRRIVLLTAVTGSALIAPLRVYDSVPGVAAQTEIAPCGYVDGFDWPVPDIEVEHSDFGIYRARYGGLHTGIDVAFEQLGAPVRAAARGRVTYSDPQGWGDQQGVVVLEHTMPDGTVVNTLYGHMEELNDHVFPAVNQCVERGEIVGAVGFPAGGRPHLHYEVRTRYRYEGGPGYTQVNPLELGWLNPIDFTFLARLWILPAYRGHFSLLESPVLPPLPLANDLYVIAHSEYLEEVTASGQSLWRFDTLGSVKGVLALPDGRLLAATSVNQVLVLDHGNYSALWPIPKAVTSPPIWLGNAVVFATEDNTLMAFTPDGNLLWKTAPLAGRLERWAVSEDRLAAATQDNQLSVIDATGHVLYQQAFSGLPVPFAAPDGGFLLLIGSAVLRMDRALNVTPLFDTKLQFLSGAELLREPSGNLCLYTGEGRSLYTYQPDGTLDWIAYMPGSHLRPPLLGIGGGRLIYALTTDGQVLTYDAGDGRLVAQLALYSGGVDGSAAARWLDVGADDSVTFSAGFLSIATLNGLDLLADSPAG
jgi:murein DD-endopeptidase MepM/ murein hydrolase activator NlpD